MTTCDFVAGVVALPHPGKSIGPMTYEILNSNNVRVIFFIVRLKQIVSSLWDWWSYLEIGPHWVTGTNNYRLTVPY